MTPTASLRGSLPVLTANALLALSGGTASPPNVPTIQITGDAAVPTVKPVIHANCREKTTEKVMLHLAAVKKVRVPSKG
jgi:hypothetical protein